jgi:20S proteasome subunit beta 7
MHAPFFGPGPTTLNLSGQGDKEFYGPSSLLPSLPTKRTLDPYVTGTSVLAIRYKDGVMMSADTLGSYGSLARFRSIQRLQKVGDYTLIGGSGEWSDFQQIMTLLEELIDRDNFYEDGSTLSPKEIYSYLARVMYNRRNKFDPYWNQLIVAGVKDGKTFLGQVDLHGTSFEDDTLATGYGAYLARPILREAYSKNSQMSENEARKVLEDCMRVLYYRDARTINKLQLAKITAAGAVISSPYALDTEWTWSEAALGYPVPQ